MFYDKFILECNKRNIKPTVAVVEIGFQKSVATRWKNGTSPTDVNIQKVADYFGVSFDEMKNDTQKEKTPAQGEGDILDEIDVAFYGDYKDLDEAQKDVLRDMVKMWRNKRTGE